MIDPAGAVSPQNIPLVIAHRGNSSVVLENSREAIASALALGVDMIELDIRKSADDSLFVMHDPGTGRTAVNSVRVEESPAAVLSGMQLRNGETIPALGDVFALVAGRAGLNLEIKSSGAGALAAQFLLRSGYRGHVLLSSFLEEEVIAARKILPEIPTSLIFDVFRSGMLPEYRAMGHRVISLRKTTVTKKLVDACHAADVRIYVWTVDDENEMSDLIDRGVDGIYSNKPALLKDVCERRRAGLQ